MFVGNAINYCHASFNVFWENAFVTLTMDSELHVFEKGYRCKLSLVAWHLQVRYAADVDGPMTSFSWHSELLRTTTWATFKILESS